MVTVTYIALFNSQTLCPPNSLLSPHSHPSRRRKQKPPAPLACFQQPSCAPDSGSYPSPFPLLHEEVFQAGMRSVILSLVLGVTGLLLSSGARQPVGRPPLPLAPAFLPTGVTPESPVSSSGPQAPCVRAASPQGQVALTHGNSERSCLFTPFTAPPGCPSPAGFLSFLSLRPWAPRKQGCFSFTASRVPGTLASARYCKCIN